jgi:DNA topoisomerase-6 subunit B
MSEVRFRRISAADFFYRNKDIAGFDNPAKATFTITRELIENALDACDLHGILPELEAKISEEGKGLKIEVEDKGLGIPKEHIARAFGQVLYGSHFDEEKQTRGVFGLGGKMAVMYGQITSNTPCYVESSTSLDDPTYWVRLRIDIEKNHPIILAEGSKKKTGWRGTLIRFGFEGNYSYARPKILDYLRQTAVICPYAEMKFIEPNEEEHTWKRVSKKLPPIPKPMRPHPEGVDFERVRRMRESGKYRTARELLTKGFQRIGKKTATNILYLTKRFGDEIFPEVKISELTDRQIHQILSAIKQYGKFRAPDASCLSPVNEEHLERGIRENFNPEFVTTHMGKPASYEGHPFMVTCGIAFGGDIPFSLEGKVHLFRFSNKIPLVYDARGGLCSQVAENEINWSVYGVKREDPIAVYISLATTKTPWKSTGKQAFGDKTEIRREILNALRNCGRDLRKYLRKKQRLLEEERRSAILERWLSMIIRDAAKLIDEKNPPPVSLLVKTTEETDIQTPEEE